MNCIHTSAYRLTIGGADGLLSYGFGDICRVIKGPVFEVEGEDLLPDFASVSLVSQKKLGEKIAEYEFACNYVSRPELFLSLVVRVADGSPVMKFKYLLRGDGTCRLTKSQGKRLDYGSVQMQENETLTEVRFSEFNEMLHSFCLNEVPVKESGFAHEMNLMGPLVAGSDTGGWNGID